jgi:hypothetical protein
MIDMYIVISVYTLIVAMTSFYGGFKIARIMYNYKREKDYLKIKRRLNSVYGNTVYTDTDSIKM